MPHTRRITKHALALIPLSLALALPGCDDKKEDKPADKADAKKDDKDAKTDDKVAKADDKKAADDGDAKKADDGAADGGDDAAAADGDAKADDGDAADEGGDDGAAAPPTEAGAEGPAYFAVRDRGLVVLDGGKFSVVENSPTILLRDLHVAADGKLYLLGPDGIQRIDGAKATNVAETSFKTTGTVDAFAVTKDSATIWAVGYKGISKWSDGKWETEEKTVLGADVTLIKGVVVDGNDRVWVASSNTIHTQEDGKWVDVDTSKVFKRKPYFDMMRRGPEGVAFVLASSQLVKLNKPDSIEEIDLKTKSFASLGYLSFSGNGNMALRSGVDEVMLVGENKTWKAGKDFAADTIRGVGVDDQSRVWVASDIGVAILGPGDAKTEWNSGSVLELAGQVEHIVALGAGPALPEVGEVKTGGLKGQILTNGKGLAESEVEVCPSPDMMFDKSPCNDSPVKFSGKTDADGRFTFDNVPIGAYGVAVKVSDKWQLTMTSNFGTKMKEGESYDIGSIKINSK